MFRPRIAVLVAGAFAVAALPASAPAATKTVSHKIKSGTTTLTLSPQSIANLQSMGVTMAATAPASTSSDGKILTFPVKPGTTIKTKGTNKIVSGKLVQTGALQMSKDTTIVPLVKVTTTFVKPPVLSGTFGPASVNVGTLTIRASKTKITKKGMKITGVTVRLTAEAAGAMNGVFAVTGFKANDLVGTATMNVKFK